MFTGLIAGITGSVVAVVTFFRSLWLCDLRMSRQQADFLIQEIQDIGWAWVTQTEIVEEALPKVYKAYAYLNGIFMTIEVEERMLQAGYQGMDTVARVTVSRLGVPKLRKILKKSIVPRGNEIAVSILTAYDAEKIGTLQIPNSLLTPYVPHQDYKDIDQEIQDVISGEKSKTGAILYGEPGNGKTFLIKHFALKYKIPIYIVSLLADLDNHYLIRMFGRIEGPAIILFEDFDSYFDRRKPLLNNSKFTFDTLLNVLDGVFAEHTGVVFFMTANDINKIDVALSCRPSRFPLVKKIAAPSPAMRRQIIPDSSFVEATEGLSLDSTLLVRDKLLEGCPLDVAISYTNHMEALIEIADKEAEKAQKEAEEGEDGPNSPTPMDRPLIAN